MYLKQMQDTLKTVHAQLEAGEDAVDSPSTSLAACNELLRIMADDDQMPYTLGVVLGLKSNLQQLFNNTDRTVYLQSADLPDVDALDARRATIAEQLRARIARSEQQQYAVQLITTYIDEWELKVKYVEETSEMNDAEKLTSLDNLRNGMNAVDWSKLDEHSPQYAQLRQRYEVLLVQIQVGARVLNTFENTVFYRNYTRITPMCLYNVKHSFPRRPVPVLTWTHLWPKEKAL
jgi:hypothetical protein